MSTATPYEEWFVNRPEALVFLNTVARELHWLAPHGRDLERIRHLLPIQHVRESRPWNDEDYVCSYPCCKHVHQRPSGRAVFEFNFELVRGRTGLGHIYIVTCASDFTQINRAGRIEHNHNPTVIEKPVDQISGQDLLSAIHLLLIEDCMVQ
jgi:hypothetical protein